MQIDWVYSLKRNILRGILAILTVTITVVMVFIALFLRSRLIADSAIKTRELGNAVKSGLVITMMNRNPSLIQDVIDSLTRQDNSIKKAFILDKSGRVIYSSDKGDIGRQLDKYDAATCRGCHHRIADLPSDTTIITEEDGQAIHRNINVIYNDKSCHGCHPQTDRINGKLIIDRSLHETDALINSVELIIFICSIVSLVFLIPFLSRVFSKGIDKYITKIVAQNSELSLLYNMIERLSKTLELDKLKFLVIDIVRETLDAEEINVVQLKDDGEYSCVGWGGELGGVNRKKLNEGNYLLSLVYDWLGGSLTELRLPSDGKTVIIPVSKGERRLALIVAEKKAASFEPDRIKLIDVMCRHIAVAFENALLYHMAITDELTRLYTQRHFRTYMDARLADFGAYDEKFTLLMLDIDDFKRVNDIYGHLVGDKALSEIGRKVLHAIRDTDAAFRYGGEEFAVVLPGTGLHGGVQVAERIRMSIESAVIAEGTHDIRLTVSVGVASCPDHGRTVKDIIHAADNALYAAKRSGKNRVVMGEPTGQSSAGNLEVVE